MSGGPNQYLLLPDPDFGSAEQATTVPERAGGFPGPGVPQAANEGDLVPLQEGTPTSPPDINYETLRAGGLYAGAEWGWKLDGDASTEYRGADDPRRWHWGHDPFVDDPLAGYGLEALFSSVFDRILLFRWSGSGAVFDVRYRDVGNTDPTDWTSTTFTASDSATSTAGDSKIVGVELPDGALRLAVRKGGSTTGDFDIYGSTDGGLTWTRIARDILATWTSGGTDTTHAVHMDVSGDTVRLIWVDTGGKIQTIISTDRCASWTQLTEIPSSGVVQNNGDNIDLYGSVAMAGIGDRAGTFVLSVILSTATSDISVFTAARDEDWVQDTDLTLSAGGSNVQRLAMATDSTYVWLFSTFDPGDATAQWKGYRVRRDDVLTAASWLNAGGFHGFAGSQKYQPGNMRLTSYGQGLILLHGLIDRDDSGNIEAFTGCQYIQGWSRRTVRSATAKVFDDLWASVYGSPDSAETHGSPDSPWSLSQSLSTFTWSSDNSQIEDSDNAAYRRYDLEEGASPTNKWADDSTHSWTLRVLKSAADASSDRIATRLVSASATAGNTTDCSVRHYMPGNLVVYDNVAAATLHTVLGLDWDANGFYELRWSQSKVASDYMGELAYAKIGDNAWTSSGGLTLTTGHGGLTTHQNFRFGHLAGLAAGQTSQWREVAIRGDDDLDQYLFVNPTNLRGQIANPNPTYVTGGVYVRWAGGGSFESDSFDADAVFQHGRRAMLADSPQMDYRSKDAGAIAWVFDADQTDGGSGYRRYIHDGIALFGTVDRQVRVQYNASDSWGSPTVDITLTADLFTGLTVSSNDGNTVTIAGSPNWVSGELAGKYLVVEDGFANDGNSAKIAKHVGNILYIEDGDGNALDASAKGFAAGMTVAVYGDRFVRSYGGRHTFRYMRVSFASQSGNSTATGDHRIGALLPGTTLPFLVPLQWSHSDSQEGNVTVETLPSGMRVAFREGPSRRKLSAIMQGDVSRERERLRFLVDHLADYAKSPMVVVLDDTRPRETSMYARISGGTAFDQQAWSTDTGSVERARGDLSLEFEEEL